MTRKLILPIKEGNYSKAELMSIIKKQQKEINRLKKSNLTISKRNDYLEEKIWDLTNHLGVINYYSNESIREVEKGTN